MCTSCCTSREGWPSLVPPRPACGEVPWQRPPLPARCETGTRGVLGHASRRAGGKHTLLGHAALHKHSIPLGGSAGAFSNTSELPAWPGCLRTARAPGIALHRHAHPHLLLLRTRIKQPCHSHQHHCPTPVSACSLTHLLHRSLSTHTPHMCHTRFPGHPLPNTRS